MRKYYFGNFHPLSDVTLSAKDWCVLQYHRPAEEDGIIVAFRRHQSPYGSFHCQAQEIDSEADYEVTWSHTYNPSKAVRVKGAKLRSLKLEIEDCPGSVVVEYRQVSREGT